MKKRVLAILLSVVMLLGVLPVGIIAGATDGQAANTQVVDDTAAYLMNVPDEECWLTSSRNEVGWSSTLLMSTSTTDPINNPVYSSSGAIKVVEQDGETFMVYNPLEVYVQKEYKDGTADIQKSESSIIQYNEIGDANSTFTWTLINGADADAVGFTDSNVDVDKITYLAIRLKTVGGEPDQRSTFSFYDFGAGSGMGSIVAGSVLFLDKETGVVSVSESSGGAFVITGEVDGYILVPFDSMSTKKVNGSSVYLTREEKVALIAADKNIQLWLHGRACSNHWQHNSDWENKTLLLGDILTVEDIEAFKLAHAAPDFEVTAADDTITVADAAEGDSILYSVDGVTYQDGGVFTGLELNTTYTVYAKYDGGVVANTKTVYTKQTNDLNIMTVPAQGEYGYISCDTNTPTGIKLPAGATLALNRYYWGMPRWSSTGPYYDQYSVDIDGESMFETAFDASHTSDAYANHYHPASYSLKSGYDVKKTVADMFPGEDLTDYKYVAMRLKIVDHADVPTVTKLFSYAGTTTSNGVWHSVTGQQYWNYNSYDITNGPSGQRVATLPANFDGWIIYPEANFGDTITVTEATGDTPAVTRPATIEDLTLVGYTTQSNTHANKTFYIGDIKIIKDLDTFKAEYFTEVDYSVSSNGTGLVVTNKADTDKNAVYSLDKENWYNIDEFNALKFVKNTHYTVYAKWSWALNSSAVSKKAFNANDTATSLMYVGANQKLVGKDGSKGLGWVNGSTMKDEFNTAFTSSDTGYLHSEEFEGEYYWDIQDNPAHNGCHQLAIFPLYGQAAGTVFDNAAEYSHLAIRLRLDEDDDSATSVVEGATYPVSINAFGAGAIDGNYGAWSWRGVYFYDIETGETYEVTSDNKMRLPLGFNGYLVFPSTAVYNVGDDPTTDEVETNKGYYSSFAELVKLHIFTHNAGGSHGVVETDDWTGATLYVGNMDLVEDIDAFMSVRAGCDYSGSHVLEAVEGTATSAEAKGQLAHYACVLCGATFKDAEGTIPMNPGVLTFGSASLTLEQNIVVNFKVNADNVADFENLYVKFAFDGTERIVYAGDAVNGKYVFAFDNVGPHLLGETITATLYGTHSETGTEFTSELTYSVKEYCYNKLAQYADSDDVNEFKTLLVDLLNYGAKAQIYSGTNTNDLVNAALTEADKKYQTITPPTVNNGVKGVYNEIEETVSWVGVNLYFEDVVGIKFRFTAPATEGLTVKVMDAKSGGNVLAEIAEFTEGANGSSIAYFDGLDATEMRKTIYAAVYNGETQVSEVLAYSIVAYAGEKVVIAEYDKATDAEKNRRALVSYMMRYGDAAAAYAAANA